MVAMTEGLDGNTPFSAQLHNHLTFNKLPRQERIQPSWLAISHCETCLTKGRYMVFRVAERGLSSCGKAGLAKRNMPNGERTTQTGYGEHGKTTVPLTGSTKNAAQLLHQNIIQDASRQGQCGAYPKRLLSVHTHRLSRYDLIGIDARPFVAPR